MPAKTNQPTVPFNPYSGSEPYIFVSYSHGDASTVYAELSWLRELGFNIWFDEGISPSHSWPEELALSIQNCSVFLLFVTPRSADSENCEREMTFALDAQKPFLAIHLEETQLPPGLKLSIGNRQAILRQHHIRSDYREKVVKTLVELLGAPVAEPLGAVTASRGRFSKSVMAFAVIGLLGVAATWAYQIYQQAALKEWARDTAIPEIIEHAEEQRFTAAFNLALQVDAILPDDPILARLWPRFSSEVTGDTLPTGANVFAKPYAADDSQWRLLGTTPLKERIPLGPYLWRVEHKGYQDALFARTIALMMPPGAPPLELTAVGDIAPEMVPIPGASIIVPFAGFPRSEQIAIAPFHIDRYEVTNREFLEFVEAGGYENPEVWRGLSFIDGDRALDWQEARKRFVDETGRVGPSTWRLSRYSNGTADHPVSGVSWYEAVAYARFREKSLPSLYHWTLATHGPRSLSTPLAAQMISLANIGGQPLQAVGASSSIGTFGTYDSAGNVREWMWNEGADGNRWILGGSAAEAEYAFTLHYELPPLDRSPQNGIRLMRAAAVEPDLLAAAEIHTRSFHNIDPVADDSYQVLREQFYYDEEAVTYDVAKVSSIGNYRWEEVSVRPFNGEGFTLHVFTPPPTDGLPRQAVVYFPGRSMFLSAEPNCAAHIRTRLSGPLAGISPASTVLEMDRALVLPVWTGSCERYDGFYEASPHTQVQLRASHVRAWYEELGQTLDYLDTRADIQSNNYGFLGLSYGASRPLPLLAMEDRIGAAVLYSGGFPHGDWPQIADAVNYVGRTTLPVLMLSGRFDAYRPIESAQRPFFDLLATPIEHKRFVVYEAGHFPLPRAPTLTETADWFDRYLTTPDEPQ